mmetsp:Transcript_22004/g.39681  ORF Transcript_22004/g.39681 Transcript_22004/m.39681 type:complete len:421 (-) Transcript_22004:1369-2631(-)|eukprot:CAMPEP_0198286430 /NCGR_PEP_ID=MMETSP1449-20131203/5520_1 /TAXON_ID=420275 /ORGANISM="Attheya septentrionalis, Strain CCMP2084" /LENGTH=420 /DNA_ID=CAMNT_0043984175 /DNA_START=68 /DNA_END=1330 /DNA_ORIENTATION=-
MNKLVAVTTTAALAVASTVFSGALCCDAFSVNSGSSFIIFGQQQHLSRTLLRIGSAENQFYRRPQHFGTSRPRAVGPLCSDNFNNDGGGDDNLSDSDSWEESADDDWETELQKRQDGSLWSSFEPTPEDADTSTTSQRDITQEFVEDEGEEWLNTLAALTAEEINFNMKEADRADKVRQMQEWGFSSESISSTLGVAQDDLLETDDTSEMIQSIESSSASTYYAEDEVDAETVESHTTVELDEDTGERIRNQMVYVDEHACIGCTNCAMIAQSTFFMDQEHGRARVFQQWGDDDETIKVAIMTCPVDCIHYVPFDELKQLEIGRRDQNINNKARLVNQAEYASGGSHMVGGAKVFTEPQQISGNMGSRCNNCPSRGCKNCPMYGIGENPDFKIKETERKDRIAKKRLKEQMESNEKSVDL